MRIFSGFGLEPARIVDRLPLSPATIVVLDKSSLLAADAAGDVWPRDAWLGVSSTLWSEVWTGSLRNRESAFSKLNQHLDRLIFLRTPSDLLRSELFHLRPCLDLVDARTTEHAHEHGLQRLRDSEIDDLARVRHQGSVMLWDLVRDLRARVERRRQRGDRHLEKFLKERNLADVYGRLKDGALSRRTYRYFAEETDCPLAYDSVDDRWFLKNFVNSISFAMWDEYLTRESRRIMPKRFLNDCADIEHVSLGAVCGALATRDKRMMRRLRVLRPDAQTHD